MIDKIEMKATGRCQAGADDYCPNPPCSYATHRGDDANMPPGLPPEAADVELCHRHFAMWVGMSWARLAFLLSAEDMDNVLLYSVEILAGRDPQNRPDFADWWKREAARRAGGQPM